MITALGAKHPTMATYGFRARPSRVGLPTTMATGTISSLGAIRGWITNRGDLRHFIMAGGFLTRDRGAGCRPRPGLRALSTCVPSTRRRWWRGWGAHISPSEWESAEEVMRPARVLDGFHWA